jgi:hypothetical protein
VSGAFVLKHRIHLTSPVKVCHEVGAERGINYEFTTPIAIRVLETEQVGFCEANCRLEPVVGGVVLGELSGWHEGRICQVARRGKPPRSECRLSARKLSVYERLAYPVFGLAGTPTLGVQETTFS